MKKLAIAAAMVAGLAGLALWALCAIGRELEDWQDPCEWPDY